MRALRRYLINGLLIWVPVLVTVLVVRFILQLMDQHAAGVAALDPARTSCSACTCRASARCWAC